MITNFFIAIIAGILRIILLPLRLLPDVTLDSGFGATIADATHYIASLKDFLPLSTIMTILLIVIGIETVVLLYKAIMWAIRRLPTQG